MRKMSKCAVQYDTPGHVFLFWFSRMLLWQTGRGDQLAMWREASWTLLVEEEHRALGPWHGSSLSQHKVR